ncbi:MAG TPA: hypothetical protein VIU64_13060 [Polyangia bacterium]
MTSTSSLLERTTGPLDDLRRAGLDLALRNRVLGWVLIKRERRFAVLAPLHAAAAFALAVWMPVLPFVLGPIFLGVPHVVADLRHLVVRRKLDRWWRTAVFFACASLIGVAAAQEARVLRPATATQLESTILVLWAALGVSAGTMQSRRWSRGLAGLAAVGAMAAVAFRWPEAWRLAFLHGHNVVAIAVWAALFRPRGRRLMAAWPALLAIGGAGLLASGLLYRVALESRAATLFGLHVLQAADWVVPASWPVDAALGVTSAYVFLQSIHYAIWLYFIPQDDRRGQGTPTFRMSVRSLTADIGAGGLALASLAGATVLAGALLQILRARALYLSLSLFHGYLELVLVGYLLTSASRADSAGPGCRK